MKFENDQVRFMDPSHICRFKCLGLRQKIVATNFHDCTICPLDIQLLSQITSRLIDTHTHTQHYIVIARIEHVRFRRTKKTVFLSTYRALRRLMSDERRALNGTKFAHFVIAALSVKEKKKNGTMSSRRLLRMVKRYLVDFRREHARLYYASNDLEPDTWTQTDTRCCDRIQDSCSAQSNTDGKRSSVMSGLERDQLGQRGTGDGFSAGLLRGLDHIQNPQLNKGMAFTIEERQTLGIHGLLPAAVKTQEEQLEICRLNLERYTDDLSKYIYLIGLLDRNEKLFYRLMATNIAKMLPLVYTPTVGQACQKFGLVYRRPRGLFISIHDKGHVYDVLKNWPECDVRAIVVTDGERILGLGDLGAYGMGIPVGKLSLYTALGGIKPHQCLPITLDVGTNTQSLLDDPLYIGHRHKRVTGQEYDDFLDEFMRAVVKRYGQNILIQFEDFGNSNAFRLLNKYRDDYCTFNDDIQGTAAVAVAGLLASLCITKKKLSDNVIVFQGAGEAALGIANLCVMAMQKEGTSVEDAKNKIWMVDSKGLIVKDRPAGGLTEHKLEFARNGEPINTLVEVVKTAKPSVLIGAAAIGGAFTKEILEEMATNNDRPVIFALSNPTSKAECTAEEAYTATKGRCVFASGSPFPPVTYGGKTFYPGQGNNSYIFPGIALAAMCAGMRTIPEETFLVAAETVAGMVSNEDLDNGNLYPPLSDIPMCSLTIATHLMKYSYENCLATVYPEPKNYEEFLKAQLYDTSYKSSVPPIYAWPKL